MKVFNVNSKPFSVWIKGITALSLSIALQGRACGSQGGTAGHMATNIDVKKFREEIENTKDISILDEKKRSKFYAVVKYNEPEKVKIILDQYAKDKESKFQHKHPDFLNARDALSTNTPLEEAIIQGYAKIVDLLINHTDIDIKTKHPTSGNTVLHLAIEKIRLDIAKKLIDCLKKEQTPDLLQAPKLLFEQNSQGNTPLHLAMKYKLPSVQNELIQLVSRDKNELSIKNKEDETVIDVAIQHDQAQGILLIKQLPFDLLCTKNKKEETLLHKAAYKNKFEAFKAASDRMSELAKTDKKVVEQLKELFGPPAVGKKSIWESIYLSGVGLQPALPGTNIKMFEYAIKVVQDNLEPADWHAIRDSILNGIKSREGRSTIKSGISKKYADQLRNIVNKSKS